MVRLGYRLRPRLRRRLRLTPAPSQPPTLPHRSLLPSPIAASYRAQLAEFRKGVRAVLAGGSAAANLSLQRTLHLEDLVRACAHMCERGTPRQTRSRPAADPQQSATPGGNP